MVLDALEEAGLENDTIIIFTSDHGYHLGEHDFWAKVSLRDVSSGVPLIISLPGQKSVVSDSLVELIDLYPTLSSLCGLPVPERLQGKDISGIIELPNLEVRQAAFSVAPMRRGFLLRTREYAYIQYEEDASKGIELFDVEKDPNQYTNLAMNPEFTKVVDRFKIQMAQRLADVRENDSSKNQSC